VVWQGELSANLGIALAMQGKLYEAIAELRTVNRLDPTRSVMWEGIGVVSRRGGFRSNCFGPGRCGVKNGTGSFGVYWPSFLTGALASERPSKWAASAWNWTITGLNLLGRFDPAGCLPERSRSEFLGPWLDSHTRITGVIRGISSDSDSALIR
jgi:hypothetical protein